MYEQDDCDIRASRLESKLEPKKNVMLRCRLPGGIIESQQWRVLMSLLIAPPIMAVSISANIRLSSFTVC